MQRYTTGGASPGDIDKLAYALYYSDFCNYGHKGPGVSANADLRSIAIAKWVREKSDVRQRYREIAENTHWTRGLKPTPPDSAKEHVGEAGRSGSASEQERGNVGRMAQTRPDESESQKPGRAEGRRTVKFVIPAPGTARRPKTTRKARAPVALGSSDTVSNDVSSQTYDRNSGDDMTTPGLAAQDNPAEVWWAMRNPDEPLEEFLAEEQEVREASERQYMWNVEEYLDSRSPEPSLEIGGVHERHSTADFCDKNEWSCLYDVHKEGRWFERIYKELKSDVRWSANHADFEQDSL